MKLFFNIIFGIMLVTSAVLLFMEYRQNNMLEEATFQDGSLYIVKENKKTEVNIKIATDDPSRMQGLMFVKNMPKTHGMLFVYDKEAIITMWMKNTYIPLDMVFIGRDFSVKHIHKNAVPHSLDVIPSVVPAKYVLELNAGVVEELNIEDGDKIEIVVNK